MVIIGGGAIGCELAQAFCRLGVGVTVVESESRILPQADPEVAELLQERLASEGVAFRLGTRVESVGKRDGVVHVKGDGADLETDSLLVAVGRRPNLNGLNVEAAGESATPMGTTVDRRLRTSQERICAAGDCLGGPQFTH